MFGQQIKVAIFGESHGKCVGGVIENIRPGLPVNHEELQRFMNRRRPGGKFATKRKETDKVLFLSGIKDEKTTGFPIAFQIKNNHHRTKDYENLQQIPRPSHADYTAWLKYHGYADMSGGGHFSARVTAAICVAGFLARKQLEEMGIEIMAHLKSVYHIVDDVADVSNLKMFHTLREKEIAMLNDEKIEEVKQLLDKMRKESDSVGGVVECIVTGVKGGYGGPLFDGLEGKIAPYLFAIPGVKGVDFGAGFSATKMKGSEHNDAFQMYGKTITTKTNHAGGILGGISDGMPIVMSCAFKPTASISKEQDSVDLQKKIDTKLVIKGRHDPCIAVRAVPVVEAMVALAVLDVIYVEKI